MNIKYLPITKYTREINWYTSITNYSINSIIYTMWTIKETIKRRFGMFLKIVYMQMFEWNVDSILLSESDCNLGKRL